MMISLSLIISLIIHFLERYNKLFDRLKENKNTFPTFVGISFFLLVLRNLKIYDAHRMLKIMILTRRRNYKK